MKTKPLTQVCNVTTGKLDANAGIPNGRYPFFTCAPDPLRIDTFAFNDDVILLAGNNAQGNFHIQRFKGKFNAYQRTYVITAKDGYDIDYIKYSLELSLQHLKRLAQGSQTKFLTMQILNSFQVIDIPQDDQRNLVGSIREMDKKISLNIHICSELEAMAKTLYNYWFVQFDFPDENGRPYRASGGEMVWNEQLKREIPKGWTAESLSHGISDIHTGLNPRNNFVLGDGDIQYLTVKNLTPSGMIDFSGCDTVNESARNIIHARSDISIGDILFASIAPLGRCYLIQGKPQKWDINESVFSIRANTDTFTPEFLYMYFMSDSFIKSATSSSTGSVFKGIRINTLLDIIAIFPKKNIIDLFSKRVQKIFALKEQKAIENQELSKLRDWLLPLLMNGQARVE